MRVADEEEEKKEKKKMTKWKRKGLLVLLSRPAYVFSRYLLPLPTKLSTCFPAYFSARLKYLKGKRELGVGRGHVAGGTHQLRLSSVGINKIEGRGVTEVNFADGLPRLPKGKAI